MNKRRVVLTIDEKKYLIPEDQAKDLTGLLANLSAWVRIKNKNYSSKDLSVDGEYPPDLGVAIVNEDAIDGLSKKPEPEPETLVDAEVPL